MNYSIIGSGHVGAALARLFARQKIKVAIANSRGTESLASLTKKLGPSVFPQSVQDAYEAKMIFLAVPFPAHKEVAKQFKTWKGKIVVDVTNALDVAPKDLGGRLSSEIVSKAFVGARLVKAFNHLPAAQLGTNPSAKGKRQVVFVSSNDADAARPLLPRRNRAQESRRALRLSPGMGRKPCARGRVSGGRHGQRR